MTTEKKAWSELEKVSRFTWRKRTPDKATRIAKAERNVQRRNERAKP